MTSYIAAPKNLSMHHPGPTIPRPQDSQRLFNSRAKLMERVNEMFGSVPSQRITYCHILAEILVNYFILVLKCLFSPRPLDPHPTVVIDIYMYQPQLLTRYS